MQYLMVCEGSVEDVSKITSGQASNAIACSGTLQVIEYTPQNEQPVLTSEYVFMLFGAGLLLLTTAWVFKQLQVFLK